MYYDIIKCLILTIQLVIAKQHINNNTLNSSFESKQNKRKSIIWAILFIVIAAASIYAVKKVSGEFSFKNLVRLIRGAAPIPVIMAFCASLIYISFQGLSIKTLLRSFGQKKSVWQCISYSAADIYFSAITPSATGGQPACGYLMIRDGVPASCTTICLVANWATYTLSIIIIGIATLIAFPQVFNYFSTFAKILICLGAAFLLTAGLLGLLVAMKRSAIDALERFVLKTGKKLRIIKSRETEAEIMQWVVDYRNYSTQLKGHIPGLIRSLIFNIIQRFAFISITMFMYIAVNLNRSPFSMSQIIFTGASLLGAQALISIGSTFIPIPGSMGYTDLMMLNAFSSLMDDSKAAGLELMSRSVAFYFSVIICFIITAITLLSKKKNSDI